MSGIRRFVYNLYQLSKGNEVFNHLNYLERSQWLDTSSIEEIQWVKLKKIIDYAYFYVPYYKEMFEINGLTPSKITCKEDLLKLPLLTKSDIENNIDKLLSIEYQKSDLIKNSTGGSTGQNLFFYIDRKRLCIRQAITIRGNRFADLDICEKHAYLWGSPFDLSVQQKFLNNITNTITGRCLFLSSYDLSESKMITYVDQLRRYRPQVLISYPSPLFIFSQFVKKNKIDDLKLKSIITSSEVLLDSKRNFIESVFDCKIFNRYGCREFGMIAMECSEHSGLHINSEHVYLEVLNNKGEPAKEGEAGELVITDLDNYGMPFIRYKIGDIGILSDKKCKCGRGLPLLENLEGRIYDIVVGTNGKSIAGSFWSFLFRTSVEGIKQFQVVQESMGELDIKIVVDDTFKEEYIGYLKNKIYMQCGKDMKINFKIMDEIPLTKSGKFCFVVSKCSPFVDNFNKL